MRKEDRLIREIKKLTSEAGEAPLVVNKNVKHQMQYIFL